MKSTFSPPSLELVHEIGCTMGLPMRECEKFYAYFESVGWVVGRARKPMKSIRGAIVTWKMNLEERKEISARVSPSVEAIQNQTELTRVESRIEKLRNLKPFGTNKKLADEFELLLNRRKELLRLLKFSA